MHTDDSVLKQLTRDECLSLMASAPVGRIIYTRQALPAVELVNFTLDHEDIIIRVSNSGKLVAAARGAVVAFEADSVDIATRSGWSVTAIGQAQEVTDPADIAQLRQLKLSSWAPGERERFIRISTAILNGRWLGRSEAAADGAEPEVALA